MYAERQATEEATSPAAPIFSPLLMQLAERDPTSCETLLANIRDSHQQRLATLDHTADADALAQLGHKIKGAAAMLNTTALVELGRKLELHRQQADDVQTLVADIKREINDLDRTLILFAQYRL